MNTKIPTIIIDAFKKENPDELKTACITIVNTHNSAVYAGFLDLPMVDFVEVLTDDDECEIGIRPKSGVITPEKITAIEKAWGADSSCVVEQNKGFVISLEYKIK